ncbi:spore cortex-lytic enzyme [Chengkuizengella axinellae]|uniref:Spore cortex-lytic enzyme n=1 Tax=Chengkuizengella axinellae TaxID=3064388 RepID=A0ABT9IYU1_9BACL|nr:spore cortex-lytic enzyme [Chengkuizengella sp. 2205SS18-9]MDP5274541.1 spore cortex-lytic enzyme [Chengkuizengella sp. 2205SS18-9]
MYNIRRISFVVCLSFTLLFSPLLSSYSSAFSEQVMDLGAKGEDVIELQERLSYIGFYKGEIDGIYDWELKNSVIYFQKEFGLELVDGITGVKTKEMLLKATEESADSTQVSGPELDTSFSSQDIQYMAQAVYGEARGESYEGKVAVAAVILNRVEHSDFPDTVSEVIFESGAFTAVDDGQMWLSPDAEAYQAVYDAINGSDPTNEAIYYFNPETATSDWIWSREQVIKIGNHIFAI